MFVSCDSGDGVPSDGVVSAQIHPISKETYVFALCQDYKIRVWSCKVHNMPCPALFYKTREIQTWSKFIFHRN